MDSVKKNRFDYLDIARAMNLEDNNASELGLGDDEYAFYTVLMQCESTKQLDDNKMRELIHVITETVRNSATLDWKKMESKRAALRLAVKKILQKYGYPPDVARMEADRMREQSTIMALDLRK